MPHHKQTSQVRRLRRFPGGWVVAGGVGVCGKKQPVSAPTTTRQQPVGGETNEWYTPPEIFQALRCTFDLDAAAPVGGVPWIPAARSFSYHDDGLAQPWHGKVWLNPPYGPHTAKARVEPTGDAMN